MAYRGVIYRTDGRVAVVTLDQPATENLIDDSVAFDLRAACRRAGEDDNVRVVVITGSGPVFSSGAAPFDEPGPAEALGRRRVSDAIAGIPKPVICAINGDATGQGLEIALACDIRIAAEGATLAMDQARSGMLPWDGGSQRLPRLAPRGLAIEMLLTGRRVDAGEALDAGLVSEVTAVPSAEQRALERAREMAEFAPIAASYAKEAVLKGMDMPLDQAVRLEADLAVLLHSTKDRAEGIGAFLEKRQPRFTGE